MSDGLTKLESEIERFNTARDEARQATVEAHAATKDIHRAIRELRDVIAESKVAVENYTTECLEGRIAATVERGLDDYRGTVKAAMDSAVEKVIAEINSLYDAAFGNPKGGERMDDIIRSHPGMFPITDPLRLPGKGI